ncbi:hypothetical protein LCGC14_3089960 [marine sediment metagenome]|uniref:Uncharacterized protein n=1 Tax=marine sediment metagenome TaxID=412755 RepID=A0A0F8WBE2_9ZZZZ
MIHEGAHLDVTKPANFAVYLDWSPEAPSVDVDDDKNRVVFSGEWVVDLLGRVVKDAIAEDLHRSTLPTLNANEVEHTSNSL